MTYADHERIFSKEFLSGNDLAIIFDIDKSTASQLIQAIKFKSDRLHLRGKVHIQDYFDYFNITDMSRYSKPII